MPVVRGSRQEKMVVVPYRPVRDLLVRLGVALTFVVIAGGAYFYGQHQALNENIGVRQERDQLAAALQDNQSQLGHLQQEVVNREQASLIDRQALQNVQETLVALRAKNAQLEADILFYRQIMSPDNNETGLMVGHLDLWAVGAASRIGYRLELRQVAGNESMIQGYANVNVIGQQGGHEVSFPLHSLSTTETQADIKIGFRYFQNIAGEMIIPDGFVPERVQILAVDEGNGKSVERSFTWLVNM